MFEGVGHSAVGEFLSGHHAEIGVPPVHLSKNGGKATTRMNSTDCRIRSNAAGGLKLVSDPGRRLFKTFCKAQRARYYFPEERSDCLIVQRTFVGLQNVLKNFSSRAGEKTSPPGSP